MTAITGNQSSNISGTKYIDSRCIVEFRPDNNWKGEYGFDWFRRGDAEENINGSMMKSHYGAIVGEYCPKDPDYGDNAGTLQIDKPGAYPEKMYYADRLAHEEYPIFRIKGISRNYIAPCISLFFMSDRQWEEGQQRYLPTDMLYKENGEYHIHEFCKMEASVRLIIEAKNIKLIKLVCDDELSVSPNMFSNIPDGKSTDKKITIKFKYKFNGEAHKSIKVFAYHKDGVTKTFAGQINVVRCRPKKVDICFVNVNIKKNRSISSGIVSNEFYTAQQKNLKRFFSQAHIIPNIVKKSLDLYQEDIAEHLTTRIVAKNGKRYRINAVLKYSPDNTKYIGTKLERWFNKTYPGLANAYKVFFIGEYGLRVTNGKDSYLGGHANGIPSKGLVVYRDPDDSVVCHEILHCFGLYHSFSNKSKHTFEKYKTSNIMDYSTNTVSLWRWQWNVMRNAPDVNLIK